MLIALSLLFVSLVTYVIYYYYRHVYDPQNILFFKKLPGPRTVFPFGNLLDLKGKKAGITSETFDTFQKYIEKYGKTFKFQVMLLKALCTADAKFIGFILNSDSMLRKSQNYDIMKDWLGSTVLVTAGETWEKQRRMITSCLQIEYLKEIVDCAEKHGQILVEKLRHCCADSQSIDVEHMVTYCCLDISAESATGIDLHAQAGNGSEYVSNVEELCRVIMERFSNPLKLLSFTFKFTKEFQAQKKCLQVMDDFSRNTVMKRKREFEQSNLRGCNDHSQETKNEKRSKNNFLNLLLKYSDNGQSLDSEQIRQEVHAGIFGGQDTIKVGILFTLFCLAKHQEVQRKAILEQKKLFGDNNASVLQYSDIQKMEYLEMVIKETLRLYPPVPVIGRYTEKEAAYGDMTIPKGINVIIFIHQLHRLEEYFPDPLRFDPERFSDGSKIVPYSYMTFPGGARGCLGVRYAMLVIKSVVSKILRNFELLPAVPEHDLHLRLGSVLKSTNGFRIRLKPRRVE